MNPRFFTWVAECCALLGWEKIEGVKMMPDHDISWYGCFDDGMTPEDAVTEYKKHLETQAADITPGA